MYDYWTKALLRVGFIYLFNPAKMAESKAKTYFNPLFFVECQ